MKKTFIILFHLCSLLYFGRERTDTLQSWIAKFHTINNLTYSPDGRWIAARKIYANNNDSIVVLDTRNPKKYVEIITKMTNQLFLNDNTLLSSGNGKVQHTNLYIGKKTVIEDVKLSDALIGLNQYFIYSMSGIFKLFNNTDEELQTVSDVQKFVTDKNSALFVIRKKGKSNEILRLSNRSRTVLYSTDKEIKQLILSTSGQRLILTESEVGIAGLTIKFIELQTGKIISPDKIPSVKADYINVNEIENGRAYLISFSNRRYPNKNKTVDIWYGNDNNLAAKQAGITEHSFWLWKPLEDKCLKLSSSYSNYNSIGNDRYLIAFNPLEEFKNITLHPYLNINLYDTELNTYQEILHQVTKDIVHSSNGQYLIGLNPKENKWMLYNLATKSSIIIDKTGLENPVFTSDFKSILFESKNDLWKFDVSKHSLKQMDIAAGHETRIINANRKITDHVFGFKMSMVDDKYPILVKIWDNNGNMTSYRAVDKDRMRNIILPTSNRIKEIKYDSSLKQFATIEENFNMAPKIYISKPVNKKKKEIFSVSDRSVAQLKQKIVLFKNSLGTPLKGVLYYPKNYNRLKKYPAVVYIYQIKSNLSNVYSIPSNEPTGVNRRTLQENGYFVYEPDIVFDSRGTGISALDCVHSSLDALQDNTSIDKDKIGLTGHSMGGFETNFIATQSNRFAAYISGAALSDMISTYFSYDYAEQKPNHNRFETGQFEMNKPFSEDKALYFRNSPINYVEKVKAPVLVWNGMDDIVVQPEQAMEFFLGLKRNNIPVIALFYPKSGHDLGYNTDESKDMSSRALDWWNYFLKEKTDIPWIDKQIKRDAN